MMRIGVIGTGKIVAEAVPVMQQVAGIEVRALFARPQSRDKGTALAAQLGIPEVYTDVDALLAADVDVVYVANVNSAHFQYARLALLAGKHVVVEKPVVPTVSELDTLAQLAAGRGLMLFEAMTLVHMPVFERIRREVLPQLGPIRLVQCNYSQRSSRYDRYLRHEVTPAFDPAHHGGALMDLNVYNFAFTQALLGAPLHVDYFPRRGYNGVDTSGVALLHYDGTTAVLAAAKDSDSPSFGLVQGDGGWLRVEGSVSELRRVTYRIGQQAEQTFGATPGEHRLVHEFRHFRQLVAERDFGARDHYLRLSREVVAAMQQARS